MYSSPSIIRMVKSRKMRWHKWGRRGMHVGYWWENQKKEPLGRPRRRWVDIIKMDLREIGWNSTDWIDLDQDRNQWRALVNTVMNLRVP
jgi:hypothetical protein